MFIAVVHSLDGVGDNLPITLEFRDNCVLAHTVCTRRFSHPPEKALSFCYVANSDGISAHADFQGDGYKGVLVKQERGNEETEK